MFDPVLFVLRSGYHYSRFAGVLNFKIDLKTGRAQLSRIAIIYAVIVNMITFCVLPWLSGSQLMHAYWSKAGMLHEYLFLTMLGGRIVCVYVTLFMRWWQRPRLVRLVNAFRHLIMDKPQVMRLLRRGALSKCMGIFLSEVFQMIIGLVTFWDSLTFQLAFMNLLVSGITALVNIIITHYYFALLVVHGHYILLNAELRTVLAETRSLELERRKGLFITKCCAIADRLEDIAKTQYKLQTLVHHISSIFGLQTVFMSTNYYMSSVAVIYFTFSEFTSNSINADWFTWKTALVSFEIIFYFTDIHITVNIIYALLDAHAEMVKLLSEPTIFSPGLDERLETVYESFQLQLAWNPLKIPVLQLYIMEKSKAVSMASSVISSSLVLIQYDLKNS